MKAPIRARGFSLVEFMIGAAVGLLLLTAVSSVMLSTKSTQKTGDAVSRIDDSARLALSMMSQDVRVAGYRGCLGDRPSLRTSPIATTRNTLPLPLPYIDRYDTGIQGFQGNGGGFAPALDPDVAALVPAPNPGSDVLTVRIPIGEPIAVTATMASSSAPINAADATVLGRDVRAMIANCVRAAVFAVTNAAPAAVVVHSPANNSTSDLGWSFGTDATIVPMATVTWYVGATPAAAQQPGGLSLYRVVNGNAPVEVIDGVEQFRVLYGENITGELPNGNTSAERYVPAGTVANWSNVMSVRTELLLRSIDAGTTANGQSYRYGGQSQTGADTRLRMTFTAGASLRNRAK